MSESGPPIAGRYRIRRTLAQGGFGQTFLADDLVLGKPVVLKLSQPSDGEAAAAYTREMKAAARLSHPGIAALRDAGRLEDGRPYLVQDWVEGDSLATILGAGPLPLGDALAIAAAVAAALEAAHEAGVVHRDVKPANVIVPRRADALDFASAKLVDFGVSGLVRPSTGTTQAGMVFGTPLSMSPEQVRGEPQSAASDVWGLGVLLYQMLVGKPPFSAESLPEVLMRIVSEEVRFPEERPLPESLRALIERCLCKEPARRPARVRVELQAVRRELSEVESEEKLEVESEENLEPSIELDDSSPVAASRPRPASPSPPLAARTTAAVDVPASSPARGSTMLILGSLLAIAAVIATFALRRPATGPRPAGLPSERAVDVGIGLGLGAAGLLAGLGFRRMVARRRTSIQRDAGSLLLGAKGRDALTRSFAVELDELIQRCRELDDQLLAGSVALMWQEFRTAKEPQHRQSALMNVVQLLEKLTQRLSPWYVRHEKLVAFVVSAVGVLSGFLKIAEGVVHFGGKP
jgi:serine/threonine protein kinase